MTEVMTAARAKHRPLLSGEQATVMIAAQIPTEMAMRLTSCCSGSGWWVEDGFRCDISPHFSHNQSTSLKVSRNFSVYVSTHLVSLRAKCSDCHRLLLSMERLGAEDFAVCDGCHRCFHAACCQKHRIGVPPAASAPDTAPVASLSSKLWFHSEACRNLHQV